MATMQQILHASASGEPDKDLLLIAAILEAAQGAGTMAQQLAHWLALGAQNAREKESHQVSMERAEYEKNVLRERETRSFNLRMELEQAAEARAKEAEKERREKHEYWRKTEVPRGEELWAQAKEEHEYQTRQRQKEEELWPAKKTQAEAESASAKMHQEEFAATVSSRAKVDKILPFANKLISRGATAEDAHEQALTYLEEKGVEIDDRFSSALLQELQTMEKRQVDINESREKVNLAGAMADPNEIGALANVMTMNVPPGNPQQAGANVINTIVSTLTNHPQIWREYGEKGMEFDAAKAMMGRIQSQEAVKYLQAMGYDTMVTRYPNKSPDEVLAALKDEMKASAGGGNIHGFATLLPILSLFDEKGKIRKDALKEIRTAKLGMAAQKSTPSTPMERAVSPDESFQYYRHLAEPQTKPPIQPMGDKQYLSYPGFIPGTHPGTAQVPGPGGQPYGSIPLRPAPQGIENLYEMLQKVKGAPPQPRFIPGAPAVRGTGGGFNPMAPGGFVPSLPATPDRFQVGEQTYSDPAAYLQAAQQAYQQYYAPAYDLQQLLELWRQKFTPTR